MPASKKTDQISTLIHGVKPYKTRKGEKYMNAKQHEHFRNVLTS
ncbi:MAG TPA: RNA polymerase-binding protein DksA, partial [Gammaproteobacteria bacterium]|nr:RNA polymerase-binding protein DksA [Gammaproteobacteria bacterium]